MFSVSKGNGNGNFPTAITHNDVDISDVLSMKGLSHIFISSTIRDYIMLSPGKQDSQKATDADLIAGEIYIYTQTQFYFR